MARRFAQDTEVSVERSRVELEKLLRQYGAISTAVFNSAGQAAVAFEMRDRRILFRLTLPSRDDQEFTHGRVNQHTPLHKLNPEQAEIRWEKACRRKWRALLLCIKAKLISVEDEVETFEQAFLAHVVLPDGQTVADHIQPRIATAYAERKMVPLLPGPRASS